MMLPATRVTTANMMSLAGTTAVPVPATLNTVNDDTVLEIVRLAATLVACQDAGTVGSPTYRVQLKVATPGLLMVRPVNDIVNVGSDTVIVSATLVMPTIKGDVPPNPGNGAPVELL